MIFKQRLMVRLVVIGALFLINNTFVVQAAAKSPTQASFRGSSAIFAFDIGQKNNALSTTLSVEINALRVEDGLSEEHKGKLAAIMHIITDVINVDNKSPNSTTALFYLNAVRTYCVALRKFISHPTCAAVSAELDQAEEAVEYNLQCLLLEKEKQQKSQPQSQQVVAEELLTERADS